MLSVRGDLTRRRRHINQTLRVANESHWMKLHRLFLVYRVRGTLHIDDGGGDDDDDDDGGGDDDDDDDGDGDGDVLRVQ